MRCTITILHMKTNYRLPHMTVVKKKFVNVDMELKAGVPNGLNGITDVTSQNKHRKRDDTIFVTEKELFESAEAIKLYCSYVKDCEELCFFHKQYNECPFGRDIQPWIDWKIDYILLRDTK